MIDGHMHLEYGDLTKEYVLKFVNAAVNKGLKRFKYWIILIVLLNLNQYMKS